MRSVDQDLASGAGSIPVTVLTGFLGAGKTTLLNRILSGNHGLRVAVLVNDFGSINIDADLVVGLENDGNLINLANGCVCCNIRDDLVAAVNEVIARPEQPEYVLLEASGVADPCGIALTFLETGCHNRLRLDSIICVVDAEQVFTAPKQMQLKLWQIGFSDLLILNKVDLVDPAQVARIKDWLDEHFHRYRLIESRQCNVPLEVLLSVGRFESEQLDATAFEHCAHGCKDAKYEHRHDYGQAFSTWSYVTDRPLSLDRLREVVSRLPVEVYRCKGVVYCPETPEHRALLQVVGKRVDLSEGGAWGERERRTRIVLIAAAGGIDESDLYHRFESCVSNLEFDAILTNRSERQ